MIIMVTNLFFIWLGSDNSCGQTAAEPKASHSNILTAQCVVAEMLHKMLHKCCTKCCTCVALLQDCVTPVAQYFAQCYTIVAQMFTALPFEFPLHCCTHRITQQSLLQEQFNAEQSVDIVLEKLFRPAAPLCAVI